MKTIYKNAFDDVEKKITLKRYQWDQIEEIGKGPNEAIHILIGMHKKVEDKIRERINLYVKLGIRIKSCPTQRCIIEKIDLLKWVLEDVMGCSEVKKEMNAQENLR